MRTNDCGEARLARAAMAVAVAAAAVLAACDRRKPAAAGDSVVTVPPTVVPADSAPPAERVSGWDPDAGTALLVPGEGGEALLVVPGAPGDSSTDRSAGLASDVLP